MKLLKNAALSAAIAVASVTGAHAQGFGVEALGTRAQEQWGGELGVGYGLNVGPFSLRPIGGVFIHKGDNDRYYRDTFSNGDSRCRDSTNGQFANDSECVNIGFDWYAKAEAVYVVPQGLEIGGGARFSSEKFRPYATIGFRLNPKLNVKGNAGPRYFAAGLSLGF